MAQLVVHDPQEQFGGFLLCACVKVVRRTSQRSARIGNNFGIAANFTLLVAHCRLLHIRDPSPLTVLRFQTLSGVVLKYGCAKEIRLCVLQRDAGRASPYAPYARGTVSSPPR